MWESTSVGLESDSACHQKRAGSHGERLTGPRVHSGPPVDYHPVEKQKKCYVGS